MMSRQLVSYLLALTLPLGLVGCGSEQDDQAAAVALAKNLSADRGPGQPVLNQQEAKCAGKGLVQAVGRSDLIRGRILTRAHGAFTVDGSGQQPRLSLDDAEAAAKVMMRCADMRSLLIQRLAYGVPDVESCVDTMITDADVTMILVRGFSDQLKATSDAPELINLIDKLDPFPAARPPERPHPNYGKFARCLKKGPSRSPQGD